MSNKILVVGALACLSAVAVAQSEQSKDQAPTEGQVAVPRDAASGQASGKRMHKPMMVTAEESAREASTGQATGKTAANSSDVKSPRDIATGQASGKRMHQPAPVTKESDAKQPDAKPKK